MTPKVRYVGAVLDPSGYGHAARSYISALVEAGVEVTIEPVSFEPYATSYGGKDKLIQGLIDRELDWNVQILHLTPEQWHKHIKSVTPKGKMPYTIGNTVWETTNIHPSWAKFIRASDVLIDELWLPNEFNIEVFKRSLPNVPMTCVPHVVDYEDFAVHPTLETAYEGFMFFSVFQWTLRKNPEALLKAYFTEFSPDENVRLVLKTYKSSTEKDEQDKVTYEIAEIIRNLGMKRKDLPHLELILDLVPFPKMVGLYKRSDCFVSPHYGEGWGLGMSDAMACETPVIATSWSGNMEFCRYDPLNFYPVGYQMTPVYGMPWIPWYVAKMDGVTQEWAEVDVSDLRRAMREVYEATPEERERIGQRGLRRIERYSPKKIGSLMRSRLEDICER
jgi:glycosyltransferase involved in cell wall biosynthesis